MGHAIVSGTRPEVKTANPGRKAPWSGFRTLLPAQAVRPPGEPRNRCVAARQSPLASARDSCYPAHHDAFGEECRQGPLPMKHVAALLLCWQLLSTCASAQALHAGKPRENPARLRRARARRRHARAGQARQGRRPRLGAAAGARGRNCPLLRPLGTERHRPRRASDAAAHPRTRVRPRRRRARQGGLRPRQR